MSPSRGFLNRIFQNKFMSKIVEYMRETKGELKHVIWPTRKQALAFTLIVIVLSIVVAYFLGIFDFIFGRLLDKVISL